MALTVGFHVAKVVIFDEIDPPVMTNIAIEDGHWNSVSFHACLLNMAIEIVDLAIKHGEIP